MLVTDILALLRAAGEVPLSGEAMSRRLGVSRAAVWKGVEALRKTGYAISSAPRRGYRLEAAPAQITAQELAPRLTGCLLGTRLLCLDTVDSTNSEVKRQAALGAAEGLAVLAEEQTGGRGRRGNGFQSLAGRGIYLSVLLRPGVPLWALTSLTARAAVAVCRGIEAATGAVAGIKWTNDLVLNGRKICGILTELELEAESGTLDSVTLGVGVNVSQTDADFGPELSKIATSLAQEGFCADRTALAAAILWALDEMYHALLGEEASYFEEYKTRCVTLGQEVLLRRGDGTETAFAEALTPDFGLVVRHPDGALETVSAGEVSVRGLMGYV